MKRVLSAALKTLTKMPLLVRVILCQLGHARSCSALDVIRLNWRYHVDLAVWGKRHAKERVFGHRFEVPDYHSFYHVFEEICVAECYAIEGIHAKVIIDCGANIGMSSVYFARRYPDARVHAYEASRRSFDVLSRNVADVPRIHPVHGAITNRQALNVGLFVNQARSGFLGNSLLESRWADRKGSFAVEQSPNVNIVDEVRRIGPVTLAKIDIEGAEQELFADSDTIRQLAIPYYVIEYHHNCPGSGTFSQFVRNFEVLGYHLLLRMERPAASRFTFSAECEPQDLVLFFFNREIAVGNK